MSGSTPTSQLLVIMQKVANKCLLNKRGPGALTSPGNLLKMWQFGPHPIHAELESAFQQNVPVIHAHVCGGAQGSWGSGNLLNEGIKQNLSLSPQVLMTQELMA